MDASSGESEVLLGDMSGLRLAGVVRFRTIFDDASPIAMLNAPPGPSILPFSIMTLAGCLFSGEESINFLDIFENTVFRSSKRITLPVIRPFVPFFAVGFVPIGRINNAIAVIVKRINAINRQ